jgi:hypothetical protein
MEEQRKELETLLKEIECGAAQVKFIKKINKTALVEASHLLEAAEEMHPADLLEAIKKEKPQA